MPTNYFDTKKQVLQSQRIIESKMPTKYQTNIFIYIICTISSQKLVAA